MSIHGVDEACTLSHKGCRGEVKVGPGKTLQTPMRLARVSEVRNADRTIPEDRKAKDRHPAWKARDGS